MNYVLFYPDELRAESLACYGHPLVQTPNYDRLAAEGTLFENAYTAHPVCAASRCSLVTGWYPHVQGYRTLRYLIDPAKPNFFKYLRAAGFTTCLSAKNHCFDEEATALAFDRVVSTTREGESVQQLIARGHGEEIDAYAMLGRPIPAEELSDDRDYRFVDEGIRFVDDCARDEKPFFLFLSLLNPHPTYHCPEPFHSLYDPDAVPALRDASWLEGKPELYRLIRRYRGLDAKDERLFRTVNAVYLGMITYTDMLLGRVIEALEAAGVYDDTTIIVCSDHGDFAGDAGLVEKWPSAVDDMLAKVPLIVRRPGAPRGHRVAEPVQSIDIFPTVCDFEGIEIRHDQFGVSLRPQVEGGSGDERRAVYCEGGYDTREPQAFEGTPSFMEHHRPGSRYYPKMVQQQEDPESVCRVVMQRDRRWKLSVRTNGENELYDLDADPLEYRNLYGEPEHRDLVAELTQRLTAWLIHTSDVVPWEGHERVPAPEDVTD